MNVDLERSRQMVLGEFLYRWTKVDPEREAVVFGDRRLTYDRLDERANRLANGLKEKGVGHGDRVGMVMANSVEVVEIIFALAKLGAVYVPSNFRYGAPEHVYGFDLAEVKALIYASEFDGVVKEALADLPKIETCVCVGETTIPGALDYENLLEGSDPGPPTVYVDDDDTIAIIYTSGTTGKPKGVVLTHKNILMAYFNYVYYMPKVEPPAGVEALTSLMLLPTFHISGYGGIIFAIAGGQTVVISNNADPENIMAVIQEEKVNGVTLVPALWNWIVNHPKFENYELSSLLIGGTGGAVMPREVKARIVERFPQLKMIESFGMAETCSLGTFATHEDMMAKQGTVGRREFMIEARLVDDEGNDVPRGETGEIVYRGPTVLKEYYRDPETTAEAFRGGWFHSGDLLREDDDGYFYVVGRKKDIIISGGENIAAAEIEDVLFAHPRIADAAVVGVPDEKWGEAVKAFVIPVPGQTLTEDEVIAHCKEHLASYKKPQYVEFATEFPRTAGGKVQKFKLLKGALE